MRNTILYLGLFFLVFTLFGQCKDEAPKRLDSKTVYMIDTMMARHFKNLNVELDSICVSQQDSLVAIAMDSIKKVRLREIEAIIKSGLNEPQ